MLRFDQIDPELHWRAYIWLAILEYLGYDYTITSLFRTFAEQQQLRRDYESGKSSIPAARPGTSAHERGAAIDVVFKGGVDATIQALARYLGLYRPIPLADPVHWQVGNSGENELTGSGRASNTETFFARMARASGQNFTPPKL